MTNKIEGLNHYHAIILNATGAPAKDLMRIEMIMRDHIFHSTLDWQSEAELARAAREAQSMLEADRALSDLDADCRLALLRKMRAEATLAHQASLANRSKAAEAAAEYEAAKTRLMAQLEVLND